ncbi:hypothetical protein PSHT_07857 [Puccinia striiformis]|uniref:Uncharacterized protein n=1 Tax=Puccinia striiformis TaxID=27350 RepID=A0A2S4VUG4_9BASI|nr:hypothetical protein PSHT_07857 [Puccinia striiformis]
MWVIRTDEQNQPANLLRDRVHSLSKEWLAGMRADFIEIKVQLMDINSQIAQDFNDWVEAGALCSASGIPGRFVGSSGEEFARVFGGDSLLESQADLAISEMKKITDRLIDPGSLQAKPAKSSFAKDIDCGLMES